MNSGVYINVVDLPENAGWSEFVRRTVSNNRLVYFEEGLTASVMVGCSREWSIVLASCS